MLENEYLDRAAARTARRPRPRRRRTATTSACTSRADGRNYVGAVPRAGRTSGTQLQRVAELAELLRRRPASPPPAQQGLVAARRPATRRRAAGRGASRPRTCGCARRVFRRGTLACTGLEFCKLAIVETKARSVDLYTELEKRLPDFDEPLTINVNGCPNSCARFQTGDIGLKGSIVDGVEGFQVHLGGRLGEDAGFGRKSRGLKVTADGAVDYVERVLRTYLDHRRRRALRHLGPPRRRGAAPVSRSAARRRCTARTAARTPSGRAATTPTRGTPTGAARPACASSPCATRA